MQTYQDISHVAVIMDGNRRWSSARAMPASHGHKKGAEKVYSLCLLAKNAKIQYLTIYAFSSENWNRSAEEITQIQNLLEEYFEKDAQKLIKNGVKIAVIGDVSKFSTKAQENITRAVEESSQNNDLHLNIALNYGSRSEIVMAAQKISKENKEFTESNFAQFLYTGNIPDPNLLIRTGGSKRLSNFLLWQCSYTEIFFCDALWPDFSINDFESAITFYNNQKRNFGK